MSTHIPTLEEIARCSGKRVALDTETTGLNWWQNHIIGVSLYCPDAGVGGYLPTLTPQDRADAKKAVMAWSPDTTVIMHNGKFDLHFLDINPRLAGWNLVDNTVLIHLIDSRYAKGMEKAEIIFLGTESKREHINWEPSYKLRKKIWEWPLDIVAAYGYNDAVVTYDLAAKLVPMVCDLGLWDLFTKDMSYLKVLWEIERYGMLVDTDFIASSTEALQLTLRDMEQQLFDSIGYEFNWRSPQQLSKAIYTDMGIPKPKNPFADADGVDRSRFAMGGKYKSTCTSTYLLTEKVKHPLGELISSMRECDKLIRNYLQGWLGLMDTSKVLHTNFNLTGTRTGRLSSRKPNLQNVPSEVRGKFTQSVYTGNVVRSDVYNLRRALVARPGHTMVSTDYKQMEMRMFGIVSGDPFMLKSLNAGRDVHLDIAHKVWGECGTEMDKVHREWSKTISFGLIYGMTTGSLMYRLNMTYPEAANVTRQYWSEFPRIQPWLNEVIDTCKRTGMVRYWSGRIWREENPIDTYKAGNALIQGGCADLLSIAAMRVNDWLHSRSTSDHNIVNLVHDEIIVEVPDEDVAETVQCVSDIMKVPDLFGIPFMTDPKVGKDYGSLNKLGSQEVAKPPEPENPFETEDEELEAA